MVYTSRTYLLHKWKSVPFTPFTHFAHPLTFHLSQPPICFLYVWIWLSIYLFILESHLSQILRYLSFSAKLTLLSIMPASTINRWVMSKVLPTLPLGCLIPVSEVGERLTLCCWITSQNTLWAPGLGLEGLSAGNVVSWWWRRPWLGVLEWKLSCLLMLRLKNAHLSG